MAVQYAFGKIITQGLDLNVDAADPTSYPGSGTSWTSVVNRSITGSLVSCSFSSDFKGGIVFNNPSASVQFPGTLANYGTGSFTVEMAFRPSSINGIHYLVSKNSGSFPNWGVYLSGSGGSGKLFAEYRINASVSCSVSSSTVFVTGSVYQADVNLSPGIVSIILAAQGQYDAVSLRGNGTGSLTSNSPILIGNIAPSSSQAYSGSIFNTKVYSIQSSGYINYRTLTPRFGITPPSRPSKMEILLVGGGGGGGGSIAGGGGGGGFILTSSVIIPGIYNITVGDGGIQSTNGENTVFSTFTAYGGGGGGSYSGGRGIDGASGGGGGGNGLSGSAIYGTQGTNGADGLSTVRGGGGGGASTLGLAGLGGSGSFAALFTPAGGLPAGWFAGGGQAGVQATDLPSTSSIGGGGGGVVNRQGGSGSANTGGGGAGGGWNPGFGGKGGSGIVIIRYPGPQIATGGTVTSTGGDTIHTFTATGSSTFTVF
jgi:hypothetical protein